MVNQGANLTDNFTAGQINHSCTYLGWLVKVLHYHCNADNQLPHFTCIFGCHANMLGFLSHCQSQYQKQLLVIYCVKSLRSINKR